jgi:hypothetical protein
LPIQNHASTRRATPAAPPMAMPTIAPVDSLELGLLVSVGFGDAVDIPVVEGMGRVGERSAISGLRPSKS